MQESSMQFEKGPLLGALSVLTFGLTALAAVLGFGALVPVIFIFGFFLLVPLVAVLGDSLPWVVSEGEEEDVVDVERNQTGASEDGPLETLRARYARGELTDEEFERRLDRLLETENVEVPEQNRRRSYEEFET